MTRMCSYNSYRVHPLETAHFAYFRIHEHFLLRSLPHNDSSSWRSYGTPPNYISYSTAASSIPLTNPQYGRHSSRDEFFLVNANGGAFATYIIVMNRESYHIFLPCDHLSSGWRSCCVIANSQHVVGWHFCAACILRNQRLR